MRQNSATSNNMRTFNIPCLVKIIVHTTLVKRVIKNIHDNVKSPNLPIKSGEWKAKLSPLKEFIPVNKWTDQRPEDNDYNIRALLN